MRQRIHRPPKWAMSTLAGQVHTAERPVGAFWVPMTTPGHPRPVSTCKVLGHSREGAVLTGSIHSTLQPPRTEPAPEGIQQFGKGLGVGTDRCGRAGVFKFPRDITCTGHPTLTRVEGELLLGLAGMRIPNDRCLCSAQRSSRLATAPPLHAAPPKGPISSLPFFLQQLERDTHKHIV